MPGVRVDFDMQVSGLAELVAGLRTMAGPELAKVVTDSGKRSARAIVVPAIKRQLAADIAKAKSHKGAPGGRANRGPLERTVTVRNVRRRPQEMYAFGVGPRAWWRHFFLGGTKPHVIEARGVLGRASTKTVRRINKLEAGAYRTTKGRAKALLVSGSYVTRVRHPGNRGHDSVARAVRSVEQRLNERYARDLEAAYQKHIAGPTRRARPKPPST